MRYLALIGLLLAVPCPARTIRVDDDGPADFNTVQAAIDDAKDGDVVLVAPGIYTGDGNRDIDSRGKAVTVRSIDPNDPKVVASTVIDCSGTEAEPHRAFFVHGNKALESVIAGLTITNGHVYAQDGAGICCYSSHLVVRRCIITNNQAITRCDIVGCRGGNGVAVFCADSNAFITGCTISHNTGGSSVAFSSSNAQVTSCLLATNGASALDCEKSGVAVTHCTITGNHARTGAGMNAKGGSFVTVDLCMMVDNHAGDCGGAVNIFGRSTVHISNSTLLRNSCEGTQGGAVMCWANSTVSFINSTLANNYTRRNGGAVWCIGELTISNCKITGNKAHDKGGGVGFQCAAVITNSLIAGNSASSGGGGMYFSAPYSSLVLNNCTIADNKSETEGGGIFCGWNCTASVAHSIIWANTAPLGAQIGIVSSKAFERDPTTMCVAYTCLPSHSGDVYLSGEKVSVNKASNCTEADPCFVDPGYWADVNDPNIVVEPDDPNAVWMDGDYHLMSQAGRWDPASESWVKDDVTSPCIDAGAPQSPIAYEPFPNGGYPNMGAYGGTAEASKSYFGEPVCETIVAGDINGDCKVDVLDLARMACNWLGPGPLTLNQAPIVTVTEPQDGQDIYFRNTTTTVIVRAEATGIAAPVVAVKFLAYYSSEGHHHGTGTTDFDGSDGWKFKWRWCYDSPEGYYTITASALDDEGNFAVSQPVVVTVHGLE